MVDARTKCNEVRRLIQPVDTISTYTGSNPVLTTNVIRLTAKNAINEEYYKWLQTLIIYK
jgi:hypothetical protein